MRDYKSITDKKEKVKFLYENKDELIRIKKGAIKSCDPFSMPIILDASKALYTSHKDDIQSGIIKRTIIGNTYYWKDSHDDVHVGNTFAKSIKDNTPKNIFFFHDHKHEITAKVGKFDNVYEKQVLWTDLGVKKQGNTTILGADAVIEERRNKIVFSDYVKGEINQHSVGMFYVKIDLALNDSDPEFSENKDIFDQYIEMLGNKEEALQDGFFWAVKEAKLFEISAVIAGSNKLTYTLDNIEPSLVDTQKDQPSFDTGKVEPFNVLEAIKQTKFIKL